jgi:thioredoxin reductase
MARIEKADVAIIGGGPAGLAAAAEAKGAGADRVLLLERDERVGGILNQQVHDGFGTKVFNEALTGPEYAAIYENRCNERDVETWLKSMVVDITPDRVLTVQSDKGFSTIEASSVIFAMGCRERTRGAIGTPGTRPAGVYTAGAVQNYMNVRNLAVGRKVVILGSGDIGLIMARRLVLEGAEVVCVAEILPQPSGIAGNLVRCLEDFDIPLYLSTTVVEIHGKERVTGITLAQVGPKMGEVKGTRRYIECDTLLLSVGLIPETELTTAVGIDTNPLTTGAIVDDSFRTSIPGIFSCGNVLQVHDVVDFATLESEKAGKAAAQWANTGALPDPTISITAGAGLRYVLPAAISGEEAVEFTARSWKEEHHKSVLFMSGGEVLRRLKMPHMEPAGMIRVRVGQGRFKKVIDKNITVEIGE